MAGAFDYVRQQGSRTEPAGTVFALMDAPPSARWTEIDEDTDWDVERREDDED